MEPTILPPNGHFHAEAAPRFERDVLAALDPVASGGLTGAAQIEWASGGDGCRGIFPQEVPRGANVLPRQRCGVRQQCASDDLASTQS